MSEKIGESRPDRRECIYLDHAATTEMLPEVKAAMEPYLMEEFGNASTAYDMGQKSRKAIEDARKCIADIMEASPEEIYFTSGGSESDNWAIKNIAGARKHQGQHIITTGIEHHAVLHSCQYLQDLDYDITYLDVDGYGMVDMQRLSENIRRDTILITVMTGNNEIGTLEPIAQIGALAHRNGIVFHTDAVQAVGQIPLPLSRLPVDLLSASAHKFHGPKGVGFLYVRSNQELPSFIHGGSQERGKRAGTENVAGIVGMAKALELAAEEMPTARPRLIRLRNYFCERVLHEIDDVRLNGHPIKRLPGNVNFSFAGVDATSLLILLEEQGICASAGSACSTGETRISHVISAIGVPDDYAAGSVRFTMGRETTKEMVDATILALKQSIAALRRQ